MKNHNWLLLSMALLCGLVIVCQASEAPVLDIDDLSAGYVGKISEHSVLVDLTPHLQVRNLDKINGICSYHVFKPNKEEFPFTVEIKDKMTGEAVIEVVRKGLSPSAGSVLLDCNRRRSFDFLLQAHDCSSPSLASSKVPVRLDVLDSDDHLLAFDQPRYSAKLVRDGDRAYQDFLAVRATDQDCTNGGQACAYSLHHELYLESEFPFQVSNEGRLSTKAKLSASPRSYQFKVRAYDCVSTSAFVEADVDVEVHEPCVPEWTDFPREIVARGQSTLLFDQISSVQCPLASLAPHADDPTCRPDSVTAQLSLVLSDPANCVKSVDCALSGVPEARTVLFSAASPAEDDLESAEEAYPDPNSVAQPPLSYRSFSKQLDNAVPLTFDGRFGASFSLQARVRRPASADPNVKEQVFCGSDSAAANRHHYGLYFYRGSIKFLMRKEAPTGQPAHADFYPSLWEWSLPQPDGQWHLYEVRLAYPRAQLLVDGVLFAENKTNSDVVDAYELTEASGSALTSYVGACFHARTNSLVEHFEGDIASVVLTKNPGSDQASCQVECRERLEAGQQRGAEIALSAAGLDEMAQLLRQVVYVKEAGSGVGTRLVKVATSVHCGSGDKQVSLAEVGVSVEVAEREWEVRLEGGSSQAVGRAELENGVEPFRQVAIVVEEVGGGGEGAEGGEEVLLSECRVQITPERNLMAPLQNYEKVMFLQNLLDEYHFEFKETLDSVVVRGKASARSYEAFLRRLTYVVTNAAEVDSGRLLRQKQFLVSCVRSEAALTTNAVLVELNVVDEKKPAAKEEPPQDRFGFVAHKQAQKLVVGEDSDVLLDTINLPHAYNLKASQTSPLLVFLVAICIFGTGFFVVLGAIRLSTALSGKRMAAGEDSPNMDEMMWDDSGLNITENPLDKLEGGKGGLDMAEAGRQFDSDEEYSSGGEEEDDEELEGDEYGSQRFHQEHYCQSEEEEQSPARGPGLEWDDTSVAVGGSAANKFV